MIQRNENATPETPICPMPVRYHPPEHTQDIFREAFIHAIAAHAGNPRREAAASRIAWAAVKRQFR